MRATRGELEAEERSHAASERIASDELELELEATRIAGHFPGPPMPPCALAYTLARARLGYPCS